MAKKKQNDERNEISEVIRALQLLETDRHINKREMLDKIAEAISKAYSSTLKNEYKTRQVAPAEPVSVRPENNTDEINIATQEYAEAKADILMGNAVSADATGDFRPRTDIQSEAGSKIDVRVEIDEITGNPRVFIMKRIVDKLSTEGYSDNGASSNTEITLEDANRLFPDRDNQLGDTIRIEVNTEKLGHVFAEKVKQELRAFLKQKERNEIADKNQLKEHAMLIATVDRVEKNGCVVMHTDDSDARMNKDQTLLADWDKNKYVPGSHLRVYVSGSESEGINAPYLNVSRADIELLEYLFALEVPEVASGDVTIKAIVREAREKREYRDANGRCEITPRAKVAVAIMPGVNNIDPRGACIGQQGTRISRIKDELSGEQVEVIQWDADPARFIANALSPAKNVERVEITSFENKTATVYIGGDQFSLAIGTRGQNVRLAAKLTGWNIDIKNTAELMAGGNAKLGDLLESLDLYNALDNQEDNPDNE